MSGLPLNEIIHGDCLEVMKQFPDKSIDMILCDLPYGTTACKWDTVIPFEPLWEQYKRVIKDNRAIVLFGNEPFTSKLVCSNLKGFKYRWVWDKQIPSGMIYARYRPMQQTEDICVFTKNGEKTIYNPQMIKRDKPIKGGGMSKGETTNNQKLIALKKTYDYKNPTNLLSFAKVRKGSLHPTQKPVALFEYLIKTYTNEGEIVLDNCIGSGTTAIACINTGRNFIGIEIEEKYVKIARERIEKHKKLDKMRLFSISELETGKLQYKALFELFESEDYEMNDKSILDILEQIVNTCKLLSQEVYSSLDYSNSTIDICANRFQELEFKLWELQEVYRNDR